MVQTVDNLLARIRREREQATGFRPDADLSDVLTRLSLGGPLSEEDRRTSFLDPTGAGGTGLDPAEAERIRGRERLKLEETLHGLAMELLPPEDVETAMRQVRRGELVKSKLAFQAVLQNLSDATQNAERRRDLELAEENQDRTLRDARARITIDMLGKDLGAAILYALAGSGGGGGGE